MKLLYLLQFYLLIQVSLDFLFLCLLFQVSLYLLLFCFLLQAFPSLSFPYDEDKIEKSLKYLEILLDYNSHTNLTAIREEKAIIEKHFLDSLLLQNLLKEEDKTLIDIGTGAGFPGMMLAIFNEDKKFILLDSVRKKTDFLVLVKSELNLKNIEIKYYEEIER